MAMPIDGLDQAVAQLDQVGDEGFFARGFVGHLEETKCWI